jgi:hypothetical protein
VDFVRYYFLIYIGTGENRVRLAKRAGVQAVIRTEYFPNTNQNSASASLLNSRIFINFFFLYLWITYRRYQ